MKLHQGEQTNRQMFCRNLSHNRFWTWVVCANLNGETQQRDLAVNKLSGEWASVIYICANFLSAHALSHHVMRVFSRFIQAHPICIEFSLISFNYERVCARAQIGEGRARVGRTRLEKQLNNSGASHIYTQRQNPFSGTNPQSAETERNVAEYLCQTAARCLICFDLRVYLVGEWIIHQDGYLWVTTIHPITSLSHTQGFTRWFHLMK